MSTRRLPIPRRRGSIYAMVLATVACAVAMVLGGLELSQIGARRAALLSDRLVARQLAYTAMESALWTLRGDSNWRITYSDGVMPDMKFPGGTGATTLIDAVDGDLGDDSGDDLFMQGRGTAGNAVQTMQVLLRPANRPMGGLYSAIHAADGITISNGSLLASGTVSSEVRVSASAATVYADVYAPSVEGSGFMGASTLGNPLYTMPESGLTNAWAARGYVLPALVAGGGSLKVSTLTPGPAPTGSPEGIYVIDCQNQPYTISDLVMVGTLVLRNAGAGVTISGGAVLRAPAGRPVIVCDGPLTLNITSRTWTTATNQSVSVSLLGLLNVNLAGGSTVSSVIEGLVYARHTLKLQGVTPVRGSVLGGAGVVVSGSPSVMYDPTVVDNVPPGFVEAIDLKIVPGSWQQVVD